jgi:hypothetical protein
LIASDFTEASFSPPAAFAAANKISVPRSAGADDVVEDCAGNGIAVEAASATARKGIAQSRVHFSMSDCSY